MHTACASLVCRRPQDRMKYSDPRINKAALQSALLFIISDELWCKMQQNGDDR